MSIRSTFAVLLVCLIAMPVLAADDQPATPLDKALEQLRLPGLIHSAIGVTRKGTSIPCVFMQEDLDLHTKKTRILLVGGLNGDDGSTNSVVEALRWFYSHDDAKPFREKCLVSAVPCGNPDGLNLGLKGSNGSGGNPTVGYPPKGEAYNSPTDPEAAYLWRWIGMHAPDFVLEVAAPPSSDDDAKGATKEETGLAYILRTEAPSGVKRIRAVRVESRDQGGAKLLRPWIREPWGTERDSPAWPVSRARLELQRRLDRTPLEVCRQLSKHYGHELKQVQYIPAMALIGRIRFGELTKDPSFLAVADVERIVGPYLRHEQPALPAKVSGSEISGHLVFGVLADATGNKEYTALAKAAADLAFDEAGRPREAMPTHSEMSDAVFMGCPILAQVGRLTGDAKYFDMCLRHMRFMLKLNVRKDGLHRHSPLDETAWGRGNGFPALGLALSLGDLPAEHPGRAEMLAAFRAHLDALVPHQDPTGCWHQVVDVPGSYRELSATCMITFALARGVRSGWLDREKYEPAIRRGWYAIRTRVAPDGGLVDVCTGTGKQQSLRDYFDRPAILGPDPRGGAMALLVATEMLAFEQPAK